MPFTQTDVDNLKSALADGRGARTMTFSDQSVTFNSIPEMLQLLATMQAEVDQQTRSTRTRYAAVSKGF